MERFLSASFAPVVMAVAVTLSLGCYESMSAETEYSGVLVKETLEDLPNCSNGKYALVFYVSSTDEFYFCDGRDYLLLDLSGLDGVSWVVETTPALPEDCPAGGAKVSAGPDADRDGLIDAVTSSQTICNGVDGQDGSDGDDGTSCTVSSAVEGTITISCEDGTVATITDGQDGADGSACTVEDNADGSKTISCEDGTSVIVSDGTDGVPGSDGQDGANGTSCTVADNGDGTKTISCEDGTSATVGDGQDGANGTSCTVADNGDGTKTISCEDGTSVTVRDGQDGASCTVQDNLDGTYALTCGETTITVRDGTDGADGQDGASCTVQDNLDGTYALTCGAETVIVNDGQDGTDGASCSIAHNCDGTATISCDDGTSVTVDVSCSATESREASCSDCVDNDCDGYTDADDFDCRYEWLCNDGIDNDGDGSVDCADPDCGCCVPPEVDCEFGGCTNLDTDPVCSDDVIYLGFVDGDTGADQLTRRLYGEAFFRLDVREDESSLLATPLSVQIDLFGSFGADYDLRAGCDNCENLVQFSENSGTNEQVILRWNEETNILGLPSGSDSGRFILIEVVYVSAEVCSNWTLRVTGNTDTEPDLITCSSR